MKIPSEVKIGYKNYNVNMIEGNLVEDNKVCYGTIDYDEGNIKLSNLYSNDQKKCTFIHESIHGIDDIMEIDLDEDQVRKLGKGVYQFIKDNPEVFKNEVAMDISKSNSISIEIIIGEVERRMRDALFDMSKRNPCEISTRIEKEISGLNEFLREQYE